MHPQLRARTWNASDSLAALERLSARGVIGFFDQAEVTEVFAMTPGETEPLNIFAICVAEDRAGARLEALKLVSPERIRLKSLNGWSFGVARYTRPFGELRSAFEGLAKTGGWAFSGKVLRVGTLHPAPPQFVPPDTAKRVPWNSVLKNNFWNGSHVLEWADPDKARLAPFFDKPERLKELAEAVRPLVPIGLDGLSDRLGNIAIQLPVTVMMADVYDGRNDGWKCAIDWHPHATPRPVRAILELTSDDRITGFVDCVLSGPISPLPAAPGYGLHRVRLWDDAHGVLLMATGDSSFIETVVFNTRPINPEPRVFFLKDEDGNPIEQRVTVFPSIPGRVGEPRREANNDFTQRRVYREETARLAAERRFVQYRPYRDGPKAEHQRALGDVRSLIAAHGEKSVWLWDPYLSAEDIARTLFYCPHAGSELRALSGAEDIPDDVKVKEGITYLQKQRDAFAALNSNFHALRLEYRARLSGAGWPFHDRFLIFPDLEHGAQAWSLGTSVNGLGKQHHILQRVDDGQRIVDAFKELWDALKDPADCVWKRP